MKADNFTGRPGHPSKSQATESPFAIKTQRVIAPVPTATPSPPPSPTAADRAAPEAAPRVAVTEGQTIPPAPFAGGATRRGMVAPPDEHGRPRRFDPAPVLAPPAAEPTLAAAPVAAISHAPEPTPVRRSGPGVGLVAGAVVAVLALAGGGWYFVSERSPTGAPEMAQVAAPAPVPVSVPALASVAVEPEASAPTAVVAEASPAAAGNDLDAALDAKREAEALIALAREGTAPGRVEEGLAAAYAGANGAQRRFGEGELRAARDLWRAAGASAGKVAVNAAKRRYEAAYGEVPAKIFSDYAPVESVALAEKVREAEQLAASDPKAACEAYAAAMSALTDVRAAAARQIALLAEKAVASKDAAMAVYFYEQELRLVPGSAAAQAYLFRNKFQPGQALKTPTGLELTYVPPGSFRRGTPTTEPGRDADEVQHTVTLTRGYYMGRTEVTQGEWDRVMGANDAERRIVAARLKREFVGADKPMILVTWEDAREFCRRVGEREGARYRLPTEAEWEHACRAGTTTAFNLGPGLSRREANIDDNSVHAVGAPVAVGASGPPNAWGLSDLHGNVWEWCADWSAPYPATTTAVGDPTGPADDKIGRPDLAMKVVRGGSWNDGANEARSGNRWEYSPVVVTSYIGFRVVREIDFSLLP